MDKYNGMKTIGDGTYGSVVKAMNMKTGTSIHPLFFSRRNCSDKEDEEEVLQMGRVCESKGNPVADEALASQHCATVRSDSGKEHPPLRL